ncbi:MAG: hypothetical protein M1378_00135 [Bacteroidetes bacterium]|nr:hypothetical protein [Bacteroidota bacterium]
MQTIKYSESTTCPKCGSDEIYYDASFVKRTPVGFGFTAEGHRKFEVDSWELKGWKGECADCHEEIHAYTSKRLVRRFPGGINRKIRAITK